MDSQELLDRIKVLEDRLYEMDERREIESRRDLYRSEVHIPTTIVKSEQSANEYADQSLSSFINSTYNPDKTELEGLIDGKIVAWFYPYVPSLVNPPAIEWTSNEIKDKHLGDLFYDTTPGHAYRFVKVADVYSWGQLIEIDVMQALADASNAQDTADNKRRVFVVTPFVPYDLGDLWAEVNKDMRKCITAKAIDGVYSASDWEIVDTFSTNAASVVVADEATSQNQRRADYIVPFGDINAQDTINTAINSLPPNGGKVLLLEGTYWCDNPILLKSNIELCGMGTGTVIKWANAKNRGLIRNHSHGNSGIKVSNILMDGNNGPYNLAETEGIEFVKVAKSTISGVHIKNFKGSGVILDSCDNCIVGDCNIYDNIVDGIVLTRNYGDTNPSGNVISNCMSKLNRKGISMWYASNNSISGNVLSLNKEEGIVVLDSSDNVISGNIVSENSQQTDNTHDNFYMVATGGQNSNYNNVQSNIIRRGSLVKQPRYGIYILNNSCIGNLVTNNDLYLSGKAGNLADGGLNTKTAAGNRV